MTEKEKLKFAVNRFTESWFDELKKSSKHDTNLAALQHSYMLVSEQSIKAFLEWFDNPVKLIDHDELINQYKIETKNL